MIKLTRAYKGEPIYVNPYFIQTVYSDIWNGEQVTIVVMGKEYCWYVVESVEEVLDMIGKASTFCV